MNCDLERHFGDLARELPESEDAEPGYFVFTEASLPVPPRSLSSDLLCLRWNYVFQEGWTPGERVSLEAEKPTYRQLGLLILATVFHSTHERTTVELTHQRGNIRKLIVESPWSAGSEMPGLNTRPHHFIYYPEVPTLHPWSDISVGRWDMPRLSLTNEKRFITDHGHIQSRDVAVGFGNLEGTCLFAELLLNVSLPQNDGQEFALEGERGFGGVSPGSAEATIWLPGGLGYLGVGSQSNGGV